MSRERLVIKVGTNVLQRPSGRLDYNLISELAEQIASLRMMGHEVLLVSSGSMGAGRELLHLGQTVTDQLRQHQLLVDLLILVAAEAQAAAARALLGMVAGNEQLQGLIAKSNGIPPLINLVSTGDTARQRPNIPGRGILQKLPNSCLESPDVHLPRRRCLLSSFAPSFNFRYFRSLKRFLLRILALLDEIVKI